MRPLSSPKLGRLVVSFFEDYLPTRRGMSSHTLRSYRDAIVLWLQFAARDTGRRLESLRVADLSLGDGLRAGVTQNSRTDHCGARTEAARPLCAFGHIGYLCARPV